MTGDPKLAAIVARIQAARPERPCSDSCIDFELGDVGDGVRVLIDYRSPRWRVSTSIGRVRNDVYTPMLLDAWTEPLRVAAQGCTQEVLDCFRIDRSTMTATKMTSCVLLSFCEAH